MDVWQSVFLISLTVALTIAIGWDTLLGRKFKEIEDRQFSDPVLRQGMDLSKMTGMGRAYRAKDQALRLAEPERSAALLECAKLQIYVRTVVVMTALVFLAMVLSLLFR